MPDWSYHPFFKPLLFRLRPELGRSVTFCALEFQSRTAVGRWLFRLLSAPPPPASAAFAKCGMRFPTRFGLSAGLNPEGRAADFLQDHFGFGFVEHGPAGSEPVAPDPSLEPLRPDDARALVTSEAMAGPPAADLAARMRRLSDRRCPQGLALRGDEPGAALASAESGFDFFSVPGTCADRPGVIVSLRALTRKPLLVRLPLDRELPARAARAYEEGADGWLVGTGQRCDLLPHGEWEGPALVGPTAAAVAALRAAHGDAPLLIARGGATTPEDARQLLNAGADLVGLRSGFVHAGPGLPLRCVAERTVAAPSESVASQPGSRWGWPLLMLTGWILIAAGALALGLAATIKMLPPDIRYLGMTMGELCERNACRIVHFMAHDRASFGGALISIGIIYHWLATVPLRAGEAWAWWTLLISGIAGFGSFLSYLGYGYLDPWHGAATLAMLPIYLVGMAVSGRAPGGERGLSTLFKFGAPAWRWSPAHLGRLGIGFAGFGMVAGGLTIMLVGMTRVFVSTDLEFMGTTVEALHALNPRLVPLIAHDRAGFGGALVSGGLAISAAVWRGARPGDAKLWRALLLSGLIGFVCAIGVHPLVGYTSFIHLLPALAGFLAFLYGIAMLHRPLCRDPAADRFSDT